MDTCQSSAGRLWSPPRSRCRPLKIQRQQPREDRLVVGFFGRVGPAIGSPDGAIEGGATFQQPMGRPYNVRCLREVAQNTTGRLMVCARLFNPVVPDPDVCHPSLTAAAGDMVSALFSDGLAFRSVVERDLIGK